jgi:hypothetical protein
MCFGDTDFPGNANLPIGVQKNAIQENGVPGTRTRATRPILKIT